MPTLTVSVHDTSDALALHVLKGILDCNGYYALFFIRKPNGTCLFVTT